MSTYYMSLSSFCLKYKRPLCLVVFILLGFILIQVSGSIKEGLEVTDWNWNWNLLTALKDKSVCSDVTTCNTCNKSYLNYTEDKDKIRCAWKKNTSNNLYSCVSAIGSKPGDDFTCPTDTSNTKPGCTACPKLKLLDTPTWLLDQ